MKTLFFNPNLFFSEKLKKEVSFKNPVLIMLALSLIALISSFLVMNKIKESLPSDANSFMYVLIIGGAVGAVVSTFIYWVILTGIFYLISSVFHAEGSFKRTLGVCKLWICAAIIRRHRKPFCFVYSTALIKCFVTKSTTFCGKY